jgi:hypothetical protein
MIRAVLAAPLLLVAACSGGEDGGGNQSAPPPPPKPAGPPPRTPRLQVTPAPSASPHWTGPAPAPETPDAPYGNTLSDPVVNAPAAA